MVTHSRKDVDGPGLDDLTPAVPRFPTRTAATLAQTITTPLTYQDAMRLATSAVGDALAADSPYVAIEQAVAHALMAVDVASREQALVGKVHDEATCKTCAAIKAKRAER